MSGKKKILRTNLEIVKPVVKADQPVDCRSVAIDRPDWDAAIERLTKANAVEKCGRRDVETPKQYYHTNVVQQYRVKKWAREYVHKIESRINQLPCGHRAHIHNVDGRLDCKHCDEQQDFDRKAVKRAISK